eukprot:CAMPEP_0115005678 /NCGR_PEP_ID=MMETSP0216-20121206/20027_1 /TAXON_ID=223996 /ORGANISM="Protocruzia adherens, Strain Boccale" /LENGTH=932 /DNA_ID=CAMNT_0002372075 /DNA_START=130 /DNA_END=2931 /DNA_ORIENTATION=+
MNETKEEESIFQSLSLSLSLDAETVRVGRDLYHSFKKYDKETTDTSRLQRLIRCAILVSSKLQIVPTMEGSGSFVRGTGVSITNLLSAAPRISIDDFHVELKGFIKKVNIDPDTFKELNTMIANFAFSLLFFHKFEEVWKSLKIYSKTKSESALHSIQNCTWIIFILARVKLLQRQNEVIECCCLLIGVLHFVLTHLPQGISCEIIDEVTALGDEIADQSDEKDRRIFDTLCQKLRLQEKDAALATQENVLTMLKELADNGVLRFIPNSDNFAGVLESKYIVSNMMKLNTQYQTRLGQDQLDERHFYAREVQQSANAPFKLTPFLKQGGTNTRVKRTFNSQRVLNYDNPRNVTIGTKLRDIKFPSSKPCSPYLVKSLPNATPISMAMEMNNWLNSFASYPCDLVPFFSRAKGNVKGKIDSILADVIGGLTDKLNKICIGSNSSTPYGKATYQQKSHSRRILIEKLFYRMLSEVLTKERKRHSVEDLSVLITNESFLRSLVACCIETVMYVHNIIGLDISATLELCNVSAFNFWKNLITVLQLDTHMPYPLRCHFGELEIKVVTQYAWQRGSDLHQLIDEFMKTSGGIPREEDEDEENFSELDISEDVSQFERPYEMFFQRVLQNAAYVLMKLTQSLGIEEETREEIWTIMRFALSEQTHILINRHLDQILLATLYGVCRAKQSHKSITFNTIIVRYTDFIKMETVSQTAVSNFTQVFQRVYLKDDTYGDIIKFYNSVYIQTMKHYIVGCLTKWKKVKIQPNTPKIKALDPQSPLKECLPQNMLASSTLAGGNGTADKSPMSYSRSPYVSPMTRMTPTTKQLYSFAESPNLNLDNFFARGRHQPLNFDINTKSKSRRHSRNSSFTDSTLGNNKYSFHTMSRIAESRSECNNDENKLKPASGDNALNDRTPSTLATNSVARTEVNFDEVIQKLR